MSRLAFKAVEQLHRGCGDPETTKKMFLFAYGSALRFQKLHEYSKQAPRGAFVDDYLKIVNSG